MRLLVIFAFILSFSAFILGLLTLLAGSTLVGSTHGFMEFAAILRYNYSPSNWASLHILGVCSSSAQDIICAKTRTGMLNGKSLKQDGKGPVFAPTGMVLLIGLSMQIGCAGLASLLLPWMVKGMKHWNGFVVPLLAIGFLGSVIASVAGSAYSLGQTHITIPHDAPITYSPVWVGLLWGGFFSMLFATALERVEGNFERFTPSGLEISKEYKPSDVPVWVWNPWKKGQGGGDLEG